ncbi:MAG TPA: Crp/Fnr family transcriptional regulator, partial [Clostridiaceae bacterium]|nr:Crp/Fnr family transcriptional regulator [Clostridiaceae bacterium]
MIPIIGILKNTELFFNINEKNIKTMLKCLGNNKRNYTKGDFIFLAGKSAPFLCILLSGKAQVIKENILGD